MWLLLHVLTLIPPDSKVHGATMGPISGRQDQGGPHVGPMNFAIWASMDENIHYEVWDEIILKFENRYVITSHTLLGMWLLAGAEVNQF